MKSQPATKIAGLRLTNKMKIATIQILKSVIILGSRSFLF